MSVIIILLIISNLTLNSMDTPKNTSIVSLQLDDSFEPYPIARWKVTSGSNTLCKQYGLQRQKNIIYIPYITRKAITLYDHALDNHIHADPEQDMFKKHFASLSPKDQRKLIIAAGKKDSRGKKQLNAKQLSSQLCHLLLPQHAVSKHILGTCQNECNEILDTFESAIIIDNLLQGSTLWSSAYCYTADNSNIQVKPMAGGTFKYFPKIEDLYHPNFDGENTEGVVVFGNKKYILNAYGFSKNKTLYRVTSAELHEDMWDTTQINLWVNNPEKIITTIQHPNSIDMAHFSPDGMWLASASHCPGEVILTNLDDSCKNLYLSDTHLLSPGETPVTLCFNNSCNILAIGMLNCIKLYDLTAQKFIQTLPLWQASPLIMEFNNDDSRLVCYLGEENSNIQYVNIWDTSNIHQPKLLRSTEFLTNKPLRVKGRIIFNYHEKNIVAIEPCNQDSLLFFDISSGKLLSQFCYLSTPEKHDTYHTIIANLFMPGSRYSFIGINKPDGSTCIKMYDYKKGKHVAEIPCKHNNMDGLGITRNNQRLVGTFIDDDSEEMMTSQTELIKEDIDNFLNTMAKKINIIDVYLLLELDKAKKQNTTVHFHPSLTMYLQDHLADNETEKNLIKKHILK